MAGEMMMKATMEGVDGREVEFSMPEAEELLEELVE